MTTLYRIREVSDLFVDACVRHPQTGELLLLSAFGRDGALLAFFAAFSLPKAQGGRTEFTLIDDAGLPSSVHVSRPDRLTKLTGKLPKGNLFGNLAHAWLYDPDLTRPDRSNRTAWGLYRASQADDMGSGGAHPSVEDRTWRQICDLSPVPLAPEWRPWVMDMAARKRHLTWLDAPGILHPPLGPIKACRLDLGVGFVKAISEAVRCGDLPMPGELAALPGVPKPATTPTIAGLPLPLGRVVATPGIEGRVPRSRVMACLQRHRHGDWGCLPESDCRANNAAVRTGEDRILSAFEIDPSEPSTGSGANTFWVITERVDADHRVTTVLLPSEY